MKSKRMLKMKELSDATGVAPGTIRYYIQQGVLPRPIKTHKNMAYYDKSYIERIRTIKELQKSRFFPLEIIKTIIADMDFSGDADHLQLLKEIENPFLENGLTNGHAKNLTPGEMMEHCGLPKEDVDAMVAMGLITPSDGGHFDRESVRMAELIAELRQVGLSADYDFQVEHLRVHMDLIEFLARKEADLFTRRIAGREIDRDDVSRLAKNAIGVINKLLPILHVRMVRKIFEETG